MPRLQAIRNAALAACVGACCAMADTPVENVDHFGRLPGQTVEILPGELFDEFHAEQARPVLGYKDGETWRALVCAQECRLEWVKIRTHATTVQPYDGEPIAGETMTLDHRPDGTLIALFRDLPGKPQAKPPTTLHAGMQQYPAARSPGSMEIDIPRNGEPPLRVTPRLPRDDPGALNIWLEGGPQLQLLGAVPLDGIVGFAGQARGPRLLQWAGDLDGDGKVDFVMSFSSRMGEQQSATLFLSSAARAGEIVHPVATFRYFPVESPGC